MSHFIKPINKQEQKKIMKKKKKEVLYARHATDKVFYLSDISLISFTYMWISWQKKKKKSIFGFPCLRKRYVRSQVYERQYTYVGCMRYEIVSVFYHTHK